MELQKINEWLGSAKSASILAAGFFGLVTIVGYSIHIEHLPKLTILGSATSIGGLGIFTTFALILFATITALPVGIMSLLNMEIAERKSGSGIENWRWAAIFMVELLLLVDGFYYWWMVVSKNSLLHPVSLLAAILLVVALCGLTAKLAAGFKTLFLSTVAFALCLLYIFLFLLVGTAAGVRDSASTGIFGLVLPSMLILASPFFKGKLSTLMLLIGAAVSPFTFTAELKMPYLVPQVAMKMSKQGGFYVDRLILDKKGCQIVSSAPNLECVSDVYYTCAAYVTSRIGDPNLIRLLRRDETGHSGSKTFEIPAASIIGTQMSDSQPIVSDEKVDDRLQIIARTCTYPKRYVLDGLFSLNDTKLDVNANRRIQEIVDTVMTTGATPFIHIYGYADDSGSRTINSALSLDRAQAVRDYFVQKGYPNARIRVSAEGAGQPILTCPKRATYDRYDCGRVNRRVEIQIQGQTN